MKPSIRIRKIHRWTGLFFSLSLLMSASSGVLHQVMTRTQSAPPSVNPAGQGWNAEDIAVSISDALTSLNRPGKKIAAVNVRNIQGEPWYQFFLEGEGKPHYVSAKSGKPDEAQDEIYASQIASGYLGGIRVQKTDYLTAFNTEYINIFRILPVYRFDAGDEKETRVYVSTITGSVTRYTDRQRQFEANVFSNFHKLAFIPNKDLRDGILILMTGGIFCASSFGIALFFLTRLR